MRKQPIWKIDWQRVIDVYRDALGKITLGLRMAASQVDIWRMPELTKPAVKMRDLPGPGPRRSRFTGIAAMRREARRQRNRRAARV